MTERAVGEKAPGRLVLRALTPADRAPIEALVRAVERFPESEVEIAMELVDHALTDYDKGYLFIVADREASVAGYACWGRASMSPDVFDLYWIVVDPRLHGGGVGRALLAHVEGEVRSQRGHTLLIETEGGPLFDAARRFYLAAGYAEIGCILDYYGSGKDKVLYTKRLDR